MMRALLVGLCVVVAVAAGQPQEAPRAIAVMPFTAAGTGGANREMADALRDLLTADLSSFPEVRLVERERLDDVLREQALSAVGLTEADRRMRVGRLVGARLLLSGAMTPVDGRIRIDAHLIEVETGRVIASRRAEAASEDWVEAEQRLARELADALKLPVREVQSRAIDRKPRVNRHFLRGLGCYHAGKYDRAIAEFMHALRGDRRYVEARYWMAMSYEALGEPEHARIEFDRIVRQFPAHRLAAQAARAPEGDGDARPGRRRVTGSAPALSPGPRGAGAIGAPRPPGPCPAGRRRPAPARAGPC